MRVCISTRLTHGGSGLPFGMKRAVRASRGYVIYHPLAEIFNVFTPERHPSLLHLTPIEIFQISMCQMSVDKRFFQYVSVNPEIDNAKLINYREKYSNYDKIFIRLTGSYMKILNFATAKRGIDDHITF